MNLHHRPLFLFVVAYICGIVAAVNLGSLALLMVAIIFILGSLLTLQKRIALPILLLILVIFTLGFARTVAHTNIPPGEISELADGKMAHISGRIISDPEPYDGRIRFVLDATRIKNYDGEFYADGKVMVTIYDYGKSDFEGYQIPFFGDELEISGRLKKPKPPTNPDGFDYSRYLARRGIHSALSADMNQTHIITPSSKSPGWLAMRFKTILQDKVYNLFPETESKLLLGIMLGNYSQLPSDLQTAFLRCGSMHMFAASGFHCGVLVAIFGLVFRILTIPRTVNHILLIAILIAYAMMVGASPSIIRAATMLGTFLMAYVLWRSPDVLNIILFAALVILSVNPLSLFEIGFQLSFVAVLAIILVLTLFEPILRAYIAEKLMPKYRVFYQTLYVVIIGVAVATAAMLGTLPIVAYYFNYVSLVSVIANSLNGIFVTFLVAFGIASVAFGSVFQPIGWLLAYFGTIIADLMIVFTKSLSGISWASVSVKSPSLLFIFAYYSAFIGALEYAYHSVKRK